MPHIRIVLDPRTNAGWTRAVLWALAALLATNQMLVGRMMPAAPTAHASILRSLFGARPAAAQGLMATKLNPDRLTTTIAQWPTVSEVPKEPSGVAPVEAAKAVVIPIGTPFYAPAGITFDKGEEALEAWQPYEQSITLPPAMEERHKRIIGTMTCDYCCGSATSVTIINNCGCRHAQAFRSIAKYLLDKFGDQYSDEQIIGELQRWKGAWYPKGVVEDYLLATGRGNVLGHETHGGAGTDGRHGFKA